MEEGEVVCTVCVGQGKKLKKKKKGRAGWDGMMAISCKGFTGLEVREVCVEE